LSLLIPMNQHAVDVESHLLFDIGI
jgi:hypothetical protein